MQASLSADFERHYLVGGGIGEANETDTGLPHEQMLIQFLSKTPHQPCYPWRRFQLMSYHPFSAETKLFMGLGQAGISQSTGLGLRTRIFLGGSMIERGTRIFCF